MTSPTTIWTAYWVGKKAEYAAPAILKTILGVEEWFEAREVVQFEPFIDAVYSSYYVYTHTTSGQLFGKQEEVRDQQLLLMTKEII